MVTAELAVAMLAAFTLLAMFCAGLALLVAQMRCIDTAGEVARQAARGDEQAVRMARRQAPAGAVITVDRHGGRVRVVVRLTARPLGRLFDPVLLGADAEVVAEQGGAP